MEGTTQDIEHHLLDLPEHPREHDPEKLASLAEDMRVNGQLQEIIAETRPDGRYRVISGTGRTLAARKLGWTKIRARVLENVSDFERQHIMFSENEEVEGVNPIYQAELMQRMLQAGWGNQTKLAEKLGKTDAFVSRYLAVAELPEPVRQFLHRCKNLGLRHMVLLGKLGANQKNQIDLATQSENADWSVQELESAINAILNPKPKPSPKPVSELDPTTLDPLSDLWETLHNDPLFQKSIWEIHYPQDNYWAINFSAAAGVPSRELANFLSELGKRIHKTLDQEPDAPGKPDKTERWPTTAKEKADYVAAAKKSVSAAYAWLYGAKHPYVAGSANLTWDLFGFGSSEEGAQALLKSIEQGKPLSGPI